MWSDLPICGRSIVSPIISSSLVNIRFRHNFWDPLFGYSFQLIWKLFLDWYPNQMETVSILEICFQINWILDPIMDTSCGYPFWISDHLEYFVRGAAVAYWLESRIQDGIIGRAKGIYEWDPTFASLKTK